MPSYIPEFSYGPIRDADGYYSGRYGLLPWPDHLQPRQPTTGIELTKKGEAYCASHERLEDIDIRSLFGEPDQKPVTPKVMDADGVFFLALANDRATVAYTIERLIDMLDAMEPDREGDDGYGGDCDREPSLGWTVNGQHGEPAIMANGWGELEEVCEDEGACIQSQPHDDEGDAEPLLGWSEKCSQGLEDPRLALGESTDADEAGCGRLVFDSIGYRDANEMLRAKGLAPVRTAPGLW